jgi:DNA repair protein RecN (Recombination protein N)
LSMTSARFAAAVESRAGSPPKAASPDAIVLAAAEELGAEGADDVEFLFTPGSGMPARPLAKSASGGELSRVVLALEVVLAAGLGPSSMIFDEVDAGIGGEAALEVGRRLAALARHRQVICVTHLPQVAAFADRHLLVAKGGRGAAVCSSVQTLAQEERVHELSRMLAGVADSELAHGHAAELLAAADAAREAAQAEVAVLTPRAKRRASGARPPARKRTTERSRAAVRAS